MTLGPLLALAAVMLPQAPEAGSFAFERSKGALIEEIEAAAVAEPPVFGIDTQIRAAGILEGRDDAHAVRFLLDAGQRTILLPDPATRGHFLKLIVQSLTPLDAKQAESLCGSQKRAEPTARADPLAVCYDQFIARMKDWPSSKEAFSRALASGAYDLPGVEGLLREARESHAADFVPLLAGFIGAFPPINPRVEEIRRLESVDRKFGAAYPALSRQARRTASMARREFAAAHREQAGAESASPGTQVPEAAAAALSSGTPAEIGAEPGAKPGSDASVGSWFHLPSLLEQEDPLLRNLPDVSKLSTDEAIRLARRQEYAGARAAMLADVLDEKDAELDQRRKLSLARDILSDSLKMRSSSSRLIIQAQLARWFHQQGEMLKAGEAAQALQASFEALVQCKDQRCEVFETNADNSPGELIMTFAEYLKKNGISPAELGLNHPGLRARWLLLELQSLVEDKEKKT
jgi:hypothetical protein